MRGLREVLEEIEAKRYEMKSLYQREDLSRREIGRMAYELQGEITRLKKEAREIEVRGKALFLGSGS